MIDWNYIQAEWDWAGHIVEALAIAGVVALLFRPWVTTRQALALGLVFAIGHFHGREKRDYEVSVSMPPPQIDAYAMWRWSFDQMTDFWPATIVCCGLLFLLWWKARRPR
jgi:hypothetical protein